MHLHLNSCLALMLLWAVAAPPMPIRADDSPQKPAKEAVAAPQPARKAIERGLAFLQNDAAKWRKERTLSPTHAQPYGRAQMTRQSPQLCHVGLPADQLLVRDQGLQRLHPHIEVQERHPLASRQ